MKRHMRQHTGPSDALRLRLRVQGQEFRSGALLLAEILFQALAILAREVCEIRFARYHARLPVTVQATGKDVVLDDFFVRTHLTRRLREWLCRQDLGVAPPARPGEKRPPLP
eukprot:5354026-Amphidinium_carterae.1